MARPVICSQCGQSFATNRNLLRHQRTVQEKRQHKCDHCDNAVTLNEALHVAIVTSECLEKADLLLKAGGNINFKPSSSRLWLNETAMHFASRRNNTVMVQFLINNGANLDVVDAYGESPLAMNIRLVERSDIAAILIIHGANLAGTDRVNRPLLDACIGIKWSIFGGTGSHTRFDCVDLCRLLVFGGCKVRRTYQRPHGRQESKVEELCDWLETTRRNPHRLDDLSRMCIRKFLSKNVVQGRSLVNTVMNIDNLPKLIVDYLLLKDIANIAL